MIEIIIITTLLVLFVESLLDKFNFWFWLENKGRKSRFKVFYRFSSCKFCITFHLGWILLVLVVLLNNFNIMYVLTPFCVSGALKINKK